MSSRLSLGEQLDEISRRVNKYTRRNNHISREQIALEIEKFPEVVDEDGKSKIYLFGIILDGKLTAKFGLTTGSILDRCLEYHNTSKESKKKKDSNPILLAVIHLPNPEELSIYEAMMKRFAKSRGINLDGNKEVYDLNGFIKLFEDYCPPGFPCYRSPYYDAEIKYLNQEYRRLYPQDDDTRSEEETQLDEVPPVVNEPRHTPKEVRRVVTISPKTPEGTPKSKKRAGEPKSKRKLVFDKPPIPTTRNNTMFFKLVNEMTVKELTKIHGIGGSTANSIILHRETSPIRSLSDLRKIKGVGNATFNKLKSGILDKIKRAQNDSKI